jgi:hypothetical protein
MAVSEPDAMVMGFVYPAGTFFITGLRIDRTRAKQRGVKSSAQGCRVVAERKPGHGCRDSALAIANRFMKLAVEKGLASAEVLQR